MNSREKALLAFNHVLSMEKIITDLLEYSRLGYYGVRTARPPSNEEIMSAFYSMRFFGEDLKEHLNVLLLLLEETIAYQEKLEDNNDNLG